MTRHRLIRTLACAAVLLGSIPAAAEDDLGKLLDSIPDVENAQAPPPVEAEKPVEEEDSLPAYIKAVRGAVIASWEPKSKVIKKNPKASAEFLVKLDRDGTMTSVSAVKLSGINAYDQSVLNAIANATFPAPPPHILTEVERGVVVKIPARAYQK